MLRVLLLSLLALIALALVSRGMPPPEGVPLVAGADQRPPLDPGSPLARWEGEWEGELKAYRTDGTLAAASRARQRHTAVSPAEQEVVIENHLADGRVNRSNARVTVDDGRLECRIQGDDGSTRLLAGHVTGPAILWHLRDGAGGAEEVYREEILRTRDGDLYTLDGWGAYPTPDGGRTIMTFEGRYRRARQNEER